ncbi:MAG TPA: hypothetical protein VMZ28_25015 [Kofleriaceae bacterium]|nr:hypothetical protein [Kofleriaceae bacterium]
MKFVLGIGALLVAGFVILLVIEARPESSSPSATAGPIAAPAGGEADGDGPAGPVRVKAPEGPPDAAPLPTPEEDAEMREKVLAEHPRSPSHAPDIVDNNFKSRPMRKARNAFHKGDYPAALEAAEAALAVEPDSQSSRVLAVLSACGMGERASAQAHADKLDDMRKARVAKRCAKFGVTLRGVKDVPDNQ